MNRADLAMFLGQLDELGNTFSRNRALEESKRERELARTDRSNEFSTGMAMRERELTAQSDRDARNFKATQEHRGVMEKTAKDKAATAAGGKVQAWYQHPGNPKAVIGYSGPAESMTQFMENLAKQTGGQPWVQTGNPTQKQAPIATGTMRFPNGSTMHTPFFSPEEMAKWQEKAGEIPEESPVYTEVKDNEGNVVWKGARMPGSKNLNPANVNNTPKADSVRDRLLADTIKNNPESAATNAPAMMQTFDRLRGTPSAKPAGTAKQVNSKAEYDALPVGAAYVDSQGRSAIKRK